MTTQFDTVLTVRPTDIDYNRHVHQSAYLDYLLYARVDQMERCYKMSIQEFFKLGYSWATKSISIEYHKPAFLGEKLIVRTWVDEIFRKSVRVRFQIFKKDREVLAAEGESVYVLINTKTGKSEIIPQDIIRRFSV